MTVELDVFSGRPNPKWTLTDSESARVEEMLRDLPIGTKAAIPGLGFRGFILSDGKRRITVGGGMVQGDDSGQIRRDSKGLEDYLRILAKERGYGEFVK